jgi:hypothetical protein
VFIISFIWSPELVITAVQQEKRFPFIMAIMNTRSQDSLGYCDQQVRPREKPGKLLLYFFTYTEILAKIILRCVVDHTRGIAVHHITFELRVVDP